MRTAEGLVEGLRRPDGPPGRGQLVFRGIPYGRPPVGDLRFAAPVAMEPWDGVRPAKEFGPAAPQSGPAPVAPPRDTPPGETPPGDTPPGRSWLTLDVCAPEGARCLPVLVWIHGGAYISGGSMDPMYDPAVLAAAGMVVVTVNYRVGMEGFGYVEDAPAPANRGFLDQIAALRWVRRNIAAFGGDPALVTVAGQSAGAGSVAALLTIDEARGLFRRAIAHSVPGNLVTPALAAEVTEALAHRLGLAAPSAAALATVRPERLAAELTALSGELNRPRYRERWGRLAACGVAVCPVVDGKVLAAAPWEALPAGAGDGGRGPDTGAGAGAGRGTGAGTGSSAARGTGAGAGSGAGVELLVGHTRDEFRLFSVMAGRLGTFREEDAARALALFAPGPDGAAGYRRSGGDAERLVETVYSDALFRMPSLALARANAVAGGTSYLFELAFARPVLGACHSLDVPLVFGTFDSPAGHALLGERPDREARAVAAELQAAWRDFARAGAPGWPAYDPADQLTRILDAPSRTGRYPEAASARIWAAHPPTPFDLHGRA